MVGTQKIFGSARYWWHTPVILATQEAEIRRLEVRSQFGRPYLKKTHHKKWAGGVAQGVGPEFKPQYQYTYIYYINIYIHI
jgi:hypothetical protein